MGFKRVKERVSVIIPCYNAASYVEQCLDSIAAQTYQHLEIIFVNDGSTDGVEKIVKEWRKKPSAKRFEKNNLFVMLNLPYNIGYAGSNTTGMFLARGEYLAIQDADDLSSPKRIERQISYLKKNPKVGMVGTYIGKFSGNNIHSYIKAGFIVNGSKQIANKYLSLDKSGASYGSLMFKAEIFDKIGGLVRQLPSNRTITGHDFLFIYKCLKSGVILENIPEVLYFYRKHDRQRSKG
ncbi:putative glycosyltransferase EpsE [compost metagenome]